MAKEEVLISLAEYAKLNGIDASTVRQRAIRGVYQTARKIGRNWAIDKYEPHVDHRVKSGQYAKKRDDEKVSGSDDQTSGENQM